MRPVPGGGMSWRSGRSDNYQRERIWCSPHCLQPAQRSLFSMEEEEEG